MTTLNQDGSLMNARRPRPVRLLSAALALLLLWTAGGAMPIAARAQSASDTSKNSLLLFPFTDSAGDAYASQATGLTSAVKLRINGVGSYHATSYSFLLPSVQRALNVENTITVDDLKPPFTADKAVKIAQVNGSPLFVVGELATVTTDTKTNVVTVAVNGSLYDTQTNTALKQASVTGIGAPASVSEDSSVTAERAFNNAAGKLVNQLGLGASRGKSISTVPAASTGAGRGMSIGLLVVLAAALGLVISHNHGGNSGPASTTGTTVSGTTGGTTGSTTGPPAPPSGS